MIFSNQKTSQYTAQLYSILQPKTDHLENLIWFTTVVSTLNTDSYLVGFLDKKPCFMFFDEVNAIIIKKSTARKLVQFLKPSAISNQLGRLVHNLTRNPPLLAQPSQDQYEELQTFLRRYTSDRVFYEQMQMLAYFFTQKSRLLRHQQFDQTINCRNTTHQLHALLPLYTTDGSALELKTTEPKKLLDMLKRCNADSENTQKPLQTFHVGLDGEKVLLKEISIAT